MLFIKLLLSDSSSDWDEGGFVVLVSQCMTSLWTW